MPPSKQPSTLFNLALRISASSLRKQCDAILYRHNDVTKQKLKDDFESLRNRLMTEVPHKVLETIVLRKNLAGLIYFKATTLRIERETSKNTLMHKHLVHNVIPKLNKVHTLDLTKVEASLDLFTAISDNCKELTRIYVDTELWDLPHSQWVNQDSAVPFPGQDGDIPSWTSWLSLLTSCKKLQVIQDISMRPFYKLMMGNFSTVVRLVRDLPELRVFNCFGTCSVVSLSLSLKPRIHPLSHLDINGYFKQLRSIRWLIAHCPFITKVTWNSWINVDCDAIFEILANSDLKIESLVFDDWVPTFNNSVKSFFVKKGKSLVSLEFKKDTFLETAALSYETIVLISESCPDLKNLIVQGAWYDGQPLPYRIFSPPGIKQGLFSALEYFHCDVNNASFEIVPLLLEELTNVNRFKSKVCSHLVNDFLTSLERTRNRFEYLREFEVGVNVVTMNNTQLLKRVKRIMLVFMEWPEIRKVRLEMFELLTREATEYLKLVRKEIKTQNLDLKFETFYKH